LRGHLSSASCTVWAGSAAVALLVMITIHDSWWAIAYLLLFGMGTIARMMLITAVIAMPFAFTFNKFVGWNRIVGVTTGLLSGGTVCFLLCRRSVHSSPRGEHKTCLVALPLNALMTKSCDTGATSKRSEVTGLASNITGVFDPEEPCVPSCALAESSRLRVRMRIFLCIPRENGRMS
jgi:hypothetical protein